MKSIVKGIILLPILFIISDVHADQGQIHAARQKYEQCTTVAKANRSTGRAWCSGQYQAQWIDSDGYRECKDDTRYNYENEMEECRRWYEVNTDGTGLGAGTRSPNSSW